jgi:6-phosphogluconolactonase (cycloisomerase 2 family)
MRGSTSKRSRSESKLLYQLHQVKYLAVNSRKSHVFRWAKTNQERKTESTGLKKRNGKLATKGNMHTTTSHLLALTPDPNHTFCASYPSTANILFRPLPVESVFPLTCRSSRHLHSHMHTKRSLHRLTHLSLGPSSGGVSNLLQAALDGNESYMMAETTDLRQLSAHTLHEAVTRLWLRLLFFSPSAISLRFSPP